MWSAIASVGGALLNSGASSDAAAGQAQATREANDLRREIYNRDVERNQPAVDAGNLGRNRLLQLLGLGGTPGGRTTQTRDQLRASLAPRFTTGGGMAPQYGPNDNYETGEGWANGIHVPRAFANEAGTVDEAGLQAAIDAEMARTGNDSSAADYGSLMRDFTGADLQNEPGYQFGMAEGQKALDRRAAAAGGYFSGAALKAAQRFGQDYAGTKFGEAFNRDASNKTNKFNRLTSLTGGGQVAANQLSTAGESYANGAGNNLTANANAQGAAGISQANSWGSALNGVANRYQQKNVEDSLTRNLRRYGTTGGEDTMGFGGEY